MDATISAGDHHLNPGKGFTINGGDDCTAPVYVRCFTTHRGGGAVNVPALILRVVVARSAERDRALRFGPRLLT